MRTCGLTRAQHRVNREYEEEPYRRIYVCVPARICVPAANKRKCPIDGSIYVYLRLALMRAVLLQLEVTLTIFV